MANWAFFPLLPYIVKFLNIITFDLISIPVLSFIFSTICYILFIYNLIKYLKEKNIRVNYPLLFMIFILNSIIMFFYTLYTESLTMLLIILFLRLCDKKKYIMSGLICSLLTFAKVQGCIWCIYLFVKIFQECYKKENSLLKSFFSTIINIIKNPSLLFAIVISPLGLFLFMTILYISGLSPLAFIHIQTSWGKKTGLFLYIILKGLIEANHFFQSLFAVIFLIFSIILIKRKKFLNASIILLYIIIACSSSVASISRYILGSVIFPIELYCLLLEDYENIKKSSKEKNLYPISMVRMYLFGFVRVLCISFLFIFFATGTVILY